MVEYSYTTATQQVNNSLKTVTQAIEASHILEISSALNKLTQPTLDVLGNIAKVTEYADKYRIDVSRFTDSNMLSLDKGMVDKELQPKQHLKVNINIEHD